MGRGAPRRLPQSPAGTSLGFLSRCFFRRRVRDPARGCGGSHAPRGVPSIAEGTLGGARDREGAAALLAHILPTARAGGGKQPRLTGGGYPEAPEPGRHISQRDGTGGVCVSLPRAGAGAAPGKFRPSLRREQPTRKPESPARPQRGGRLKAATGGCLPKCRGAGHGETRPETPRCPGTGAGSGIHHSVALRVGVPRLARQRNSGPHVAQGRWGGRTSLSPPREKQGTEPAAAPGEAPLWQEEARRREGRALRPSPRHLSTLRGLAPCPQGCVSPGSVTKAWKCQDPHPRRNLPRGSAFSASSEETNWQKNKLLVPLQN